MYWEASLSASTYASRWSLAASLRYSTDSQLPWSRLSVTWITPSPALSCRLVLPPVPYALVSSVAGVQENLPFDMVA